MFGIYTALSPIYGEQPHTIGAALLKYQIDCCKINHKRSTRPNNELKGEFNILYFSYLIGANKT